MTKLLRISPDLTLPRETVTATTVIFGGKGMGKTNLAAVMAEELSAAGLRWSWLDPLGVSWGLRHSADGKGPGVECLILGGPKGDIPIAPDGGAAVADVVVEETVNVLIDFSRKPSGEMWGVGEKIRFVTDYTRRLFQRQGELIGGHRREPLCQILDEAARYIPQVVAAGNPQLAYCVSAWQQAVEEGRNIGLGVCLVTQRSARINKDVSELADALFAFRTVGPNSLQAIMDWLGQHVDKAKVRHLSEQVRSLDVGQALVVSPGWLRKEIVARIRQRTTFDSSATPRPGERARTARGQGSKPDVARIKERMAESIEKAKAEDPRELRRMLAEKDREIAQLQRHPPAPAKAEIKKLNVPRITDAQIKRIEAANRGFGGRLESIQKAVDQLEHVGAGAVAIVKEIAQVLRTTQQPVAPVAGSGSTSQAVRIQTSGPPNRIPYGGGSRIRVPPAPPSRLSSPSDGVALPPGERRILIAIAQNTDGATRQQLSQLTGFKKSSRDAYISRLSKKGYVRAEPGRLMATPEGVTALGSDYEQLPTGDELLKYWLARLPGGESDVLRHLTTHRQPVILQRDTISQLTGYKKSSRDAYIARLSARKLVYVDRAGIQASGSLFG